MGKVVARHHAPHAAMVQFLLERTQACLNVSEAFPIRDLRKGQCQKLTVTRKPFYVPISLVSIDAPAELMHRKKFHYLGEYRFPLVHLPLPSSSENPV